ncbi:MAG: hypothetical protein CK431_10205 [Mycobacterium sp.]|nr:MAG: hypothetical protein CK431_10205 [Mycobacterium sp.]
MSDDLFDGPGSADVFKPTEHNGRLLLIKPKQFLTKVPTKDYGEKDAIEADIHILDGPAAGTVLRDGRIFSLVLIGQTKGNVGSGRFNLGRLGQGPATKGNPPWKLFDPTGEDAELARRYLTSDKYKENTSAPAPAAEPAAAAAPAASDPWASSSNEPPF